MSKSQYEMMLETVKKSEGCRGRKADRRNGEMITIIVSAIISAITAKIVATYYFKKIDGYVKEMCEMTEKSNQHTLAILHKLQENPKPKEMSWNGEN